MDAESTIARYKLEEAEGWRAKIDEIPYLRFPYHWEVKVIPPFGGAYARFFVQYGDKHVSVYLDMEDRLGYMNRQPYWEIYPYNGDTMRHLMRDVEGLLNSIEDVLEGRDEEPE